MKNFTLNPNSKLAKTATFTFRYMHLIMIVVVLLLCNIQSANAQSAARLSVEAEQPTAVAEPSAIIGGPAGSAVAFNVAASGKQIVVTSTKIMYAVTVYDLNGTALFSVTGVNAREYKSPVLDLNRQILVVKAMFINDTTASKKIVLN